MFFFLEGDSKKKRKRWKKEVVRKKEREKERAICFNLRIMRHLSVKYSNPFLSASAVC